MDPLAKLDRNDRCWCGAGEKYKRCHGAIRPLSVPGQPITQDDGDGYVWVAPHTRVAVDGLHLPPSGVTVTWPTGRPEVRPLDVPPAVKALLDVPAPDTALTLPELGRHRFDLYEHAGFRSGRAGDRDTLAGAVCGVSVAVMHALGDVARRPQPGPTVLWNDDTEAARLLGQTLLWADHVCVADGVFDAVINDRTDGTLQEAVAQQQRLRPLIEAGVVVPVPQELGVAARATAAEQLTARDLRRGDVVEWVRQQLLVEGPTAREAMFVTALDDTERWPRFWLNSRPREGQTPAAASLLGAPILGAYDPGHDYEPWRQLVLNQAIAWYVQRLNERLVTGETFTADYLTTSPFEARLLARKGALRHGPAHAAVWADIPVLPDADPAVLARAAAEEEAVEDLRRQVRATMRSAHTLGEGADVLTGLGEELAHAGRRLDRTIRTERRWQVIAPAVIGAGSIALGAAGGLPGIAAGALGVAGSLVPYLAARGNRRRNAAYLFFMANRTRR